MHPNPISVFVFVDGILTALPEKKEHLGRPSTTLTDGFASSNGGGHQTGEGRGENGAYEEGVIGGENIEESGTERVVGEGADIEGVTGEGVSFSGGLEENKEAGSGRGLGAAGGHVVGELRPLNEFSAARQEALDEVRQEVFVTCSTLYPKPLTLQPVALDRVE